MESFMEHRTSFKRYYWCCC